MMRPNQPVSLWVTCGGQVNGPPAKGTVTGVVPETEGSVRGPPQRGAGLGERGSSDPDSATHASR